MNTQFSKLNPKTLQYVVKITQFPEVLDVLNTPSPRPAGDVIMLLLSSQDNILVISLSSNKTQLVLNRNQMCACQHVSHANTQTLSNFWANSL